jgi:hypothetical protein
MTIDDRGYIKVKIGISGGKDRLKLPVADHAPTLDPCFSQATLQHQYFFPFRHDMRCHNLSEADFQLRWLYHQSPCCSQVSF